MRTALAIAERAALGRTALRIMGSLAFGVLLGLSAHIRIPLPGTPVPVTLQTFTLCVGAGLLGSRGALAMVAWYLLMGIAGAPFFAGGSGWAALAGPTGGYLAGFLLAAWLIGRFDRDDRRLATKLALYAAAAAVIYVPGLFQLKLVTGAVWGQVAAMGLWPFLAGDLVKAIAACSGVAATRKVMRVME